MPSLAIDGLSIGAIAIPSFNPAPCVDDETQR